MMNNQIKTGRHEEKERRKGGRLGTSEGAWVWQMLSWWPSAPNSRGAELQVLKLLFPTAPNEAKEETPGQKVVLRVKRGPRHRCTTLIYDGWDWRKGQVVINIRAFVPGGHQLCCGFQLSILRVKWISSSQENYLSENWSVLVKLVWKGRARWAKGISFLNRSHDPYQSTGLVLCFDAQLLPQIALQGTGVCLLNQNLACHWFTRSLSMVILVNVTLCPPICRVEKSHRLSENREKSICVLPIVFLCFPLLS